MYRLYDILPLIETTNECNYIKNVSALLHDHKYYR